MDLLSYFDNNLHTMSIKIERQEKLEVDFTATSGNRKQRIKGMRQVLRFSLTSRPFAGQDFKSQLELAGLKGDLQIYVDKKMLVPLDVRGKAGWFGTLRLRLHSVVLR